MERVTNGHTSFGRSWWHELPKVSNLNLRGPSQFKRSEAKQRQAVIKQENNMEGGIDSDPLAPSLSKRAKRVQTQDVSDAEFVDRKIQGAAHVDRIEDIKGEAQPDGGPSINTNVLTGSDGRTTRVNSSHDAERASMLDNFGEPEGTKLNGQEERKKRDREFELNDSLIEDFARKISAERCSLRNDNILLHQELDELRVEAENLREAEQDLKRQLEGTRLNCESLTNELEKERSTCQNVRNDYFHFRKKITKRLVSLRQENKGLQSSLQGANESLEEVEYSLQTAYDSLEEEQEKMLCQICLEAPKDALCQPCLHYHFCFSCLETHIEQNKICPVCRTDITGITRLYS